jgi:hypothetical protein
MVRITNPAIRDALGNFSLMFAVNLIYEAIHRLRALNQPVWGFVGDSAGIAIVFALLMFFVRKPGSDNSPESDASQPRS